MWIADLKVDLRNLRRHRLEAGDSCAGRNLARRGVTTTTTTTTTTTATLAVGVAVAAATNITWRRHRLQLVLQAIHAGF